MDNIFNITVFHRTNVIDLGQCDVDHISLITLVHALSEQLTGSSNVPVEEYSVWVQLPWCSDIVEVFTDRDFLDVFREFGASKFDYVAANDRESTKSGSDEENDDNGDGVVLGGDNEDGVGLGGDDGDGDGECLGADNRDDEGLGGDNGDGEGLGANNRDGEGLGGADNEDGKGLDGDNGDGEGLGDNNRDGVFGSQFENVVGNDDITKECMNLFEGYEYRSDDEFFSDSDTDKSRVKVCNNKEAKVKWIASKFESIVKSNPSIDVKVLADLLLDKFNVSVDLKRLYSVKHRVLKQLRSEHVQSFKYLRQYAYTLNQTNPGTTIHVRVQRPLSTFHRLFLNFEAQRLGFLKGLRPFIGLDGCHLKGPCGGILLSAVALDANSGMFPLAVCICEKETKLSWMWFFNNVKMYLQYPSDRHLCFMSDKQKGLIKALAKHFPTASKRNNIHHKEEVLIIHLNLNHTHSSLKHIRMENLA
ncbi:hypothetical protein Ddye_009418 [Dipteronia dyeriana]|uniref:MULE transposase domain-containing protein n=1 Tax=Dipteronia dyeriana TaxID=168575 RepID=A0AAE0CMA2_9ROSI|nr:hypothetical protein Ddye_009418 [Dipteronia dyeriana]